MIRTADVTYTYPGQRVIRFPDLTCTPDKPLLILGPSGTGKTTLLHLLAGVLHPASGSITIQETALETLHGHKLDRFRGQTIGIIFQKPHFIRSLTAIEQLLLVQHIAGKKVDRQHAVELLTRLSIAHKADQWTHTLSLGEQQRLAIARALINHPQVILADEPSSALDDDHCTQMIGLLRQVAQENTASLIIVTHDTRIKSIIPNHIVLQYDQQFQHTGTQVI